MVSPPSGTHKVSFSVLPNPHTQADNPLIAAATLHCVHNVSGLRAGTLPGVAQQNGFLGLPLTLMQEETAYLVTQGKRQIYLFLTVVIVRTDMQKKKKKASPTSFLLTPAHLHPLKKPLKPTRQLALRV